MQHRQILENCTTWEEGWYFENALINSLEETKGGLGLSVLPENRALPWDGRNLHGGGQRDCNWIQLFLCAKWQPSLCVKLRYPLTASKESC